MSEIAGLEDYVLTVKANSFEKLLAYGTGFYIASPDNAKVTIETPEGGRFSCGVGEGARHLNPFQHLIVRNNENYDQQIKLKIGFGEFIARAGGNSGSVGSLVMSNEILNNYYIGFGGVDKIFIPANESRLVFYLTVMSNTGLGGFQICPDVNGVVGFPAIEQIFDGSQVVVNLEVPINGGFWIVNPHNSDGKQLYLRGGEVVK